MQILSYPISFAAVGQWAEANRATREEAWRRYLQFAVLHTVGSDPELSRHLVLRGAAALRLFYGGARPTCDLDFVLPRVRTDACTQEQVGRRLNDQLNRRLPCLFPDYPWKLPWIRENLKVDVSDSDLIIDCAAVRVSPDTPRSVLVCTLEDALADKIVSVSEGSSGYRKRARDLFDIVSTLRRWRGPLDLARLSYLATAKGRGRGCRFGVEAFTAEARDRASTDYESLRCQIGDAFIPFGEAWRDAVSLTARLTTSPSCRMTQTVSGWPLDDRPSNTGTPSRPFDCSG